MSTPVDMERDNYIIETGSVFSDMRVLVEGAVWLYAEKCSPLFALSYKHDGGLSATILSAIGSALYELQDHIRGLQAAYAAEICRQMALEELAGRQT